MSASKRTSSDAPTPSSNKLTQSDTDRLGFGKLLAWTGAGVSAAINFLLFGYVALYATDTLGLDPALVGGLLAVGTLAASATGLIAAWIVDRSPETRWGKARPYEMAVPALWLSTFLIFAVPSGLDDGGKIAWLAVTVLMAKAIFQPLLYANDTLYTARAFSSRIVFAKLSSRGGVITTLTAVAFSILVPIALGAAGKSPVAWMGVVGAIAGLMGLVGLSRMFFVRERFPKEVGEKPVTFRQLFSALGSSKWIWGIAALALFGQFITNVGASAYYFRYVVGDLALQGAFAGLGIIVIPAMLLLPKLVKRFAYSQIIAVAAVVGVIGSVVNGLAMGDIPLLLVGGLLSGLSLLFVAQFTTLLVLDLATYNEWRGTRRLESTMSALAGIFGSVGAGVAAWVVGTVMSATGYDGSAEKQSASAINGINFLFAWLPAIVFVLVIVVMVIYGRFDRRILPQVLDAMDQRQREGKLATDATEPVDAYLASQGEPGITSMDGIVIPHDVPLDTTKPKNDHTPRT